MQIEQNTIKATASGLCTVEDGVIYELNGLYGQRTRIGVTDNKYNELKNLADSYYDKLVELGAITPPKTAEQMQAETMQVMNGMLEQMKAMQMEMEALRNERSDTSENVRNEQPEHSEASASLGTSSKSFKRSK